MSISLWMNLRTLGYVHRVISVMMKLMTKLSASDKCVCVCVCVCMYVTVCVHTCMCVSIFGRGGGEGWAGAMTDDNFMLLLILCFDATCYFLT